MLYNLPICTKTKSDLDFAPIQLCNLGLMETQSISAQIHHDLFFYFDCCSYEYNFKNYDNMGISKTTCPLRSRPPNRTISGAVPYHKRCRTVP
ncbi:hypothetical protein BpHYR1_011507 [Brachionus plicatilis]|uniref:Uncharacterized protein n=1 Tax=Brachionus plicatilis TaxID=10195 RepID=A0A3M7S4U9_BRAPC|nr:hypothetical protein BpHYR1_011507 [Brachionus plicatilis]